MSRTESPRSTGLVWVLLALALALLAGCGRSLPPEADAGKARSGLETALEAWKKGDKPNSLHDGSPAIYLNDPQWQKGSRLVDFEIESSSEQRVGQGLCYTVLLTLQDGKGNNRQRKVVYQVHTDKAVVIAPSDS